MSGIRVNLSKTSVVYIYRARECQYTHTTSCSEVNWSCYTKSFTKAAFSQEAVTGLLPSPQSIWVVYTRLPSRIVGTLHQGLTCYFPAPVSGLLLNSRVNRYKLLWTCLHQATPILTFHSFFNKCKHYLYLPVNIKVYFRQQSVTWHWHPDSHITKCVLFQGWSGCLKTWFTNWFAWACVRYLRYLFLPNFQS